MLKRLLHTTPRATAPRQAPMIGLLDGLTRTNPNSNFGSQNSTGGNGGNPGAGSGNGGGSGSAGQIAELIGETMGNSPGSTLDRRSILANLKRNYVISPRTLSPENLLETYPPRPRLDLAHPLGLPVPLIPTHDPFVHLALSPLSSPLNPLLRAEFCTTMGKILSRGKTGLGRKSQRAVGKAVRRARCMGVVPSFGKLAPPPRR